MKAFIIVFTTVATLLGLGWNFANTHVGPVASPEQRAELPAGSLSGRARQALDSYKPNDENEVVGRYVHRKMHYEKSPSLARNVKMNDELLIMENEFEDRLSATR